jgi:hypothetical protein
MRCFNGCQCVDDATPAWSDANPEGTGLASSEATFAVAVDRVVGVVIEVTILGAQAEVFQ